MAYPTAAEIYQKFKQPFLESVPGATSKELLVRDDDVQVLHGFDAVANAQDYLNSGLFNADVVGALTPLLTAAGRKGEPPPDPPPPRVRR